MAYVDQAVHTGLTEICAEIADFSANLPTVIAQGVRDLSPKHEPESSLLTPHGPHNKTAHALAAWSPPSPPSRPHNPETPQAPPEAQSSDYTVFTSSAEDQAFHNRYIRSTSTADLNIPPKNSQSVPILYTFEGSLPASANTLPTTDVPLTVTRSTTIPRTTSPTLRFKRPPTV